MKRHISVYLLIISLTCLITQLNGEEVATIYADSIEIQITSTETADTLPAYVGGGTAISETVFPVGGRMSRGTLVRGDDGVMAMYLAGEITAPENGLLIMFKCIIINNSQEPQDFRIGDIALVVDGSMLDFIAVGTGIFVFAKYEEDRDNVKEKIISIQPGKKAGIKYVFEIPKDSESWKLKYRDEKLVELKK